MILILFLFPIIYVHCYILKQVLHKDCTLYFIIYFVSLEFIIFNTSLLELSLYSFINEIHSYSILNLYIKSILHLLLNNNLVYFIIYLIEIIFYFQQSLFKIIIVWLEKKYIIMYLVLSKASYSVFRANVYWKHFFSLYKKDENLHT